LTSASSTAIVKGDKKTINAWAMYDWANSVYSLVITTAIFPVYWTAVTSENGTDIVQFMGMSFTNTALYSYCLSFAFLLVATFSPIFSAIADSSGSKKGFMKFFCWLGGLSCISLFFFDSSNLWLGVTAFISATIGFSGSIVFYNSYLPEIAEPKDHDKVSAKGYSLGYIGSSLLLIFILTMVLMPDFYGISNSSFPARFAFVLVGIWWIGFAQITFNKLPSNIYQRKRDGNYLLNGYKELGKVWKQLHSMGYLKSFLFSFFFYNMGVQTVMYVATIFGKKEIMMEDGQLIITVLIIQFVAIGGAYLFSWVSSKKGNLVTLAGAIIIWIGICGSAYNIYSVNGFYVLAMVVGFVMGGIQSLSRSTYSKLLPETEDHASYFSFYDVCEKFGLVLGTASYGMIEEITGSMRNSIIALAIYFIVGLTFLIFTINKYKSPKVV
jgi:MFS transporter, UMF1 family